MSPCWPELNAAVAAIYESVHWNESGKALQEFFTFGDDQDEVMTLAASVTLIKDPEMIRALQKIVDAALGKTMKR